MRIESLRLENYRTFESAEIEFPFNYTTLSGRNDSGKSNVVNAIRALLADEDSDEPDDDYSGPVRFSFQNDFTKWQRDTDSPQRVMIAATIAVDALADAGLHTFLTQFLQLESPPATLRVSLKQIRGSAPSDVQTSAEIEGKTLEGLQAEQVLIKFRKSKVLIVHNSTMATPYTLWYLGRAVGKSTTETQAALEKLKATAKKTFGKIAGNQQNQLSELMGRLGEKYRIALTPPDVDFSFAHFGIAVSDKKVEADVLQWGAGTRNRAVIFLKLFRARQLRDTPVSATKVTPVILIEEPESFLHPAAQAEFGRVLQDVAEEMALQVISTTHSPFMLSHAKPQANVLVERRLIYNHPRETLLKVIHASNWMEPFAAALGIKADDLAPWHDMLFSKVSNLLLVEGETDKSLLLELQKEHHGANRLRSDIEIHAYDGVGNLKNGVLLKHLRGKCRRLFVTYDLDVAKTVEPWLTGLEFQLNAHHCPIGLDKAGKRTIEGLIPDGVSSKVYAANTALMHAAVNGNVEEQKSAKATLKAKLRDAMLEEAATNPEVFSSFYPLCKTLNKAFQ